MSTVIDDTTVIVPPASVKWRRLKKVGHFIADVAVAAKNHIVDFVKGCWRNKQSIAILTLASCGLSALLGEIPYWVALPMWVEAPMVIPVISVLIVLGIMKWAEWDAKRRLQNALVM